MACETSFPLIQRQHLLFTIQGLVMHGNRTEEASSEGVQQSRPICGGSQGWHHAPALIRRMQGATVSQQMPPADAGWGGVRLGL
jgi:hypothetical protein